MKALLLARKGLVPLAIPLFLMMTSIRLLLTPVFVQLEYHAPDFPADSYGMSTEERLKWAPYAIEYLLNNAGPAYLGDLKFSDGTPLFNERELSHMVDVKNLVQAMLRVWLGLIIGLLAFGLWSWKIGDLSGFWKDAGMGGYLTLGLIGFILVGVAVSFYDLFTVFHRIFFTGNSWLFLYSDTLIRLFPLRFWQDCFIVMGSITAAGAIAAILARRKA